MDVIILAGTIILVTLVSLMVIGNRIAVQIISRGSDLTAENLPTLGTNHPFYQEMTEFSQLRKETWTIESKDHLKLVAWYIPAALKTNKTVVIFHGFSANKNYVTRYGHLFYQLGYNVLMPDNRAAGESEGQFIGFGALEKEDAKLWIDRLVNESSEDAQIALFGTAMGAAIVGLLSGEQLSEKVKLAIMDSAYTSADNEIAFQLKKQQNLPGFMVKIVSFFTNRKAGYRLIEANPEQALKASHLPILFIAGTADRFVPVKMTQQMYQSYKGNKELLLIPKADHIKGYEQNREGYRSKVLNFANQYFE